MLQQRRYDLSVMRLLVWVLAGAIGFAVGWAGTRWIVQPRSQSLIAVPAKERIADAAVLNLGSGPAASESAAAGERLRTITKLVGEPASLSRDHALVAAISKLQPADFPAAFDGIVALVRNDAFLDSKNADLAELWMDQWLEIDAAGALRFFSDSSHLAELPTSELSGWPMENQRQSGFGGVLRALARREPEWTRQLVSEMSEGSRREVAIYTLLAEAAKGGAARAQPILSSFNAPADRRGAIVGYVTGLAAVDLHSAFEVAFSESPGFIGEEVKRLVFERAASQGVAVAGELLDRVEDPAARRKYVAQVVGGFSIERSDDVLSFIQEESARRVAAGAWKQDLDDWARSVGFVAGGTEAKALMDWAFDFAPDADRTLWAPIAQNWAYNDPNGFRTWLGEHAESFDAATLEKLAPALRSMMVHVDAASIRAWMETLPAGQVRDQVRFQAALNSARTGDTLEAQAAYRALATTDTKGELARALTQQFLQHDVAAAAKWATTQPPGLARSTALELVAKTWSQKDPTAAAGWLEQLAPGSERDSALGIFATQASRADPITAAEWVEQVEDSALRTKAAKAVFDRWKIQNPVAARAWLRGLSGVEEGFFVKEMRNAR